MRRAAALLGVLLFVISVSSIAGTTASITGVAKHDSTPLVGVQVKISSPAMQGTRTTTTDVNGRYAFVAVPPGDYTVSFEADRYEPSTVKTTIGVAQRGRADAQIKMRDQGEQATVEGTAAEVETKAVQTNLSAAVVDALPVGRDMGSVIGLTPGSTVNAFPDGSSWLLDGGVTNDPANLRPRDVYVEDAIQETTILSGAIPAEYGRFLGGVANAITRSGGNDWSGSFRDSLSNPSWTAPSPYQDIENTDELAQVFEATVGGRLIEDQLWFFAAGRQFRNTIQQLYALSPSWGYTTEREDRRWQGKLTGQVLDRHTVVASYLRRPVAANDSCAFPPSCAEPSALAPSTSTTASLATIRYTGMLTPRLAAEAYWNGYDFSAPGVVGGSTDQVTGTWGYDLETGALFGAPVFGPRYEDKRNSREYGLKATWFLATAAAGTHNVAVGYDHWASDIVANLFQSGSNFAIYTWAEQAYDLQPGDVFKPIIAPGDFIAWMPMQTLDAPSNKEVRGVYVNDAWDLGAHWSFNLGLRYDVNKLVDETGYEVSDTGAAQPRLAAVWDVRGNGQVRINASYGRYEGLIGNGIVSAGSSAGSPKTYLFEYGGPVVEGLSTFEAFRKVFDWFNAYCDSAGHCGTENMEGLVWGRGGTSSVRFEDSLRSPRVDEVTFGFSVASRADTFLRVDAITRESGDFLGKIVTQETGQTADFFGNPSDWAVQANVDAGRKETYDAVIVQGAYRFRTRWNLGGNYNWIKYRYHGSDGSDFYPELTSFERHQTDEAIDASSLRGWLMYDLPTAAGTFSFSVLENFDSSSPYGAAGAISTEFDPEALALYATPPDRATYWFTATDAYHWDNVTSTDLAIRYQLPVRWSGAFLDLNVTNVFNESAQVGGNTTIRTAVNPNCRQTADPSKRCALFNPFTETPVEGVHYVKGPLFSQPTSPSDYQTPRTYSFSAGVRF